VSNITKSENKNNKNFIYYSLKPELMEYKMIFYSIGDWGANVTRVNSAKYVANAMSNYYLYLNPLPSFVISLGDNFYENGVSGINDELWESAWFSVFIRPFPSMHRVRWYSVLGNHDYYGGKKSVDSQIEMTKYSQNWMMPDKNFFSYDKESSSYHIFIDTVKIYPELYEKTKTMYTNRDIHNSLLILEKMLIDAKRLKCKWIFVYGHYHLFSNGYYGNYNVMIQRILPLMKKYKVAVYFSGHDHNFQLLKYDGMYFCVNGAGAYKAQLNQHNSNIEVSMIYGNTNNGFLIHKLNDTYLSLQFVNINNIAEFDYLITSPNAYNTPPPGTENLDQLD
tara:strand:- start:1764 stop:2771 length:1008 start_codon:yes stop_codon:yes gene_type:complete